MKSSVAQRGKSRAYKRDHAAADGEVKCSLQTIMSRTGSFPLAVAHRLLKQEGGSNKPKVFDAFCGKGTSLLAARLLGYPAYGMDVAPEAVVCSAAKVADVTLASVVEYVQGLGWHGAADADISESVHIFFHEETLGQLMSVRKRLLRDQESEDRTVRNNARFTLACLLGILHGHSSVSLSISSSHAYAMAPAYVSRYAKEHGLRRPVRDVRECLLEKVKRSIPSTPPKAVPSEVRRGSAKQCSSVFPDLVGKVDIILTSPPYLGAQTYAKDNWLRLWFLGYDYRHLQKDYIETRSVERYRAEMERVLREMSSMLKVGGRLICVAGDVRRSGKNGNRKVFRTGAELAKIAESAEVGLRVESRETHMVAAHQRYLNAISGSNGHSKNGLVERVFVAEKVG